MKKSLFFILAMMIVFGCAKQEMAVDTKDLLVEKTAEEAAPAESVASEDEQLPDEELSALAEETEPDFGDVVE